jgi:Amt family ammonium transporter
MNFTLSQDAIASDISQLKQDAAATAQRTVYTDEALNVTWTLYSTSLVMLMQLGFSLVESGSVRSSSFRHVFLKNMLDFILGICFWWSIGYWVAFPEKLTTLFDSEKYDILNSPAEGKSFAFQAMFATTACTIVSGAMAERTRMEAYLVFVILMTSLAYSVVVQWTWGGGWMNELDPPFHDFAGSGVIHETGGVAALVGAYLVGPRIGRFYQDPGVLRVPRPFAPRSIDAIVMGTFLLWFGWFGFNPGSAGDIADTGAYPAATKAFVNTMIAPAFSALTVVFYDGCQHLIQYIRFGQKPHSETYPKFDIGMVANGTLCGLVAITAGCDALTSTYAALAGVIAAFVLLGSCHCLSKMLIDDPVGAVAVHGATGVWGLLVVGLFHEDMGLVTTGQSELLRSQCIGALAIGAYIGATTFVYFYLVSCYGFLRVSKLVEVNGVDFEEFGEGEEVDTTALEMELRSNYSSSLISTLSGVTGDREGLDDEQCRRYAHIHRHVNVVTLTLAIVYNFFYYPYFQWRGWIFWAFVNTAVGVQSAAGAHAQFRVESSNYRTIKGCMCTVVLVGVALAVINFLITPTENLVKSYLETMSMAFFWAIWMQLRLQPLEWRTVSNFHNNIREGSAFRVYLKSLSELESQDNPMLRALKFNSRLQHALEIAVVYASLIADLWVGLGTLDEAYNIGIILLVLVVVQLPGTLGKILEPTCTRSQKLVILLCINTWVSKGPILAFLFLSDNEQSAIRLISIAFNAFSLAFQIVNVFVAIKFARRRANYLRGRSMKSSDTTDLPVSDANTNESNITSEEAGMVRRISKLQTESSVENGRHQEEHESSKQVPDPTPPRSKDVPIPAFMDHPAMMVPKQHSSTSFAEDFSGTVSNYPLSDSESVAISSDDAKVQRSRRAGSGNSTETYTPKTPTSSIGIKICSTPSDQDIHGASTSGSALTAEKYEAKISTPCQLSLTHANLPSPPASLTKVHQMEPSTASPGDANSLYVQYHQSYQQTLVAWMHHQHNMAQQHQRQIMKHAREQRKRAQQKERLERRQPDKLCQAHSQSPAVPSSISERGSPAVPFSISATPTSQQGTGSPAVPSLISEAPVRQQGTLEL